MEKNTIRNELVKKKGGEEKKLMLSCFVFALNCPYNFWPYSAGKTEPCRL